MCPCDFGTFRVKDFMLPSKLCVGGTGHCVLILWLQEILEGWREEIALVVVI